MQLFKMFFIVFLLFFSVVRGMSLTTLVNDVKPLIFFGLDNNSQKALGLVNKNFNEFYKIIRDAQINCISQLMESLQKNKIEGFENFMMADDICSKYVRAHICTVLGVDNTLENNKCIYNNTKVPDEDFLSSMIHANSLLAAYIYIKQNGDKVAAIFEACKYKRHNIVRLLLGIGVAINDKNQYGNTALMRAVWENNTEVVKLLLAIKGIDVNSKNKDGNTALMWAIQKNNTKVVELLLAIKGIDVNSKNKDGNTALMLAVSKNNIEIVKLLLAVEGIDVNSKNSNGDTVLMLAVWEENIEIVKLLLATKGIDVNSKNRYGYSALDQVFWSGKIKIETLLRQAGALYYHEKWFIDRVMNFIVTAIFLCHFFIINP